MVAQGCGPGSPKEAEALGGQGQGLPAQLSKLLSKNVKCSKQGRGEVFA